MGIYSSANGSKPVESAHLRIGSCLLVWECTEVSIYIFLALARLVLGGDGIIDEWVPIFCSLNMKRKKNVRDATKPPGSMPTCLRQVCLEPSFIADFLETLARSCPLSGN